MGRSKIVCNLPEAIDVFRYHYGVELEKVIRYTMTALITTFFQLAPPRTRKIGVHSIDCDVNRVFVNRKYFASSFVAKNAKEQERVRRYFKTNNYDALQTMQKDGAILKNIKFKQFNKSDVSRNNRGRIFKTGEKVIVTNPKALNDYVKHLKANVGKLEGSFVGSLEHFGGGSYPAWIKRNGDGYFEDNTKPTSALGKQGASAVSRVEYGDTIDKRMDLINRTYAVQAAKLVNAVKANVLNKALTAYYGLPADTFTKKP